MAIHLGITKRGTTIISVWDGTIIDGLLVVIIIVVIVIVIVIVVIVDNILSVSVSVRLLIKK